MKRPTRGYRRFKQAVSLEALQVQFLNDILKKSSGPSVFSDTSRFSLYRRMVLAGIENALREVFTVCARLVGRDFFSGLCQAFFLNHPPKCADISGYGENFPDFLSAFKPSQSLVYLPDVARLEWACHILMLEGPVWETPLPNESGQQVDLSQLRLSQNGKLITSKFPIEQIWRQNTFSTGQEGCIDLNSGATRLWVFRKGFDLMFEPLSDLQWEILSAFEQRNDFFTICESLLESSKRSLNELQDAFQKMVASGWLICRVNEV